MIGFGKKPPTACAGPDDMSHAASIQGLFYSSVALGDLLDAIPAGILVMNSERRVTTLNRRLREWTGHSVGGAFVGQPCWKVVNHSICREDCPVFAMAPTDGIRHFGAEMPSQAGPPLPLSISIGPIRGAGGQVVGFLESVVARSDSTPLPFANSGLSSFPNPGNARDHGLAGLAAVEETAPPHLTWEEVERRLILDALVRSGGKRKEAAKLLGWSRSTLWRKMKARGVAE